MTKKQPQRDLAVSPKKPRPEEALPPTEPARCCPRCGYRDGDKIGHSPDDTVSTQQFLHNRAPSNSDW